MKDDKVIALTANFIVVLKALATFGTVILGVLPKVFSAFRSKKDNNLKA